MELREQTLFANENKIIYATYRTVAPVSEAHAYLQQETTTCITMSAPLLTCFAAGQKKRHERTENVEQLWYNWS
jgi:hypothetical protein